VVNNFVSGLILLAERPIKVGDLVVVGGEEGYVRKISVRSTEVETSERARVLIPNSCFITEKVKNWTLRDNIRRIVIPISVGYGCDARKVMATLLKVAQDNPNVMTTPAPSVDFDFGADTLNFKLYAFVDDLDKGGSTSTDLRIAILDAFNRIWIGSARRSPNMSPVPTMEAAPGMGRHTAPHKSVPRPQTPSASDVTDAIGQRKLVQPILGWTTRD